MIASIVTGSLEDPLWSQEGITESEHSREVKVPLTNMTRVAAQMLTAIEKTIKDRNINTPKQYLPPQAQVTTLQSFSSGLQRPIPA